MAKLTMDMKKLIEKGLVFIGTASKEGIPNVASKGSTSVLDDETLMFMEGYGKKTFENLKVNPNVTATVVDPETREGYQFKGLSVLITEGPELERLEKERGRPVKALVKINIEEIYDLRPGEKAGERIT